MRIKGMIKSVQASIAAGGADVKQELKIEVFEDGWKDLRRFMQKPLEITIEASQMEFGSGKSPMADGAIDATVSRNGRKKKDKVLA